MDHETYLFLLRDAQQAICDNRLLDSLIALEGAVNYTPSYNIRERLHRVREGYNYLLQYMSQGMIDPKQAIIHNGFIREAQEILTTLRREDELNEGSSAYAITWKTLRLMHEAKTIKEAALSTCTNEYLFNLAWTSPLWNQAEAEAAKNLLDNNIGSHTENEEHRAAMLISATMLGTLSYFDIAKINLLFYALESEIIEVRTRALVGLVMVIVHHTDIIRLYPSIAEQMEILCHHKDFSDNLLHLQLQLIISLNTKQIERTMRDDVMPEMMKAAQRMNFGKHLDLEKGITPEDLASLNPEWENNKEMEKMTSSLHRMIEIQKRGGDVYLPIFRSLMQHHPFFARVANWFTPFSLSASQLTVLKKQNKSLLNNLPHNSLSHTDKYAFCLALEQMASGGIQIPFSLDLSNSENIMETDDDLSTQMAKAIRSYVSDLYRFFNIFRHHNEDSNPFKKNFLLIENPCFSQAFRTDKALRTVADFCFEEKNYAWALLTYSKLSPDTQILQKIGFCYQTCKDYAKAIEAYNHATLLQSGSPWTWQQMAICYKALGNYSEAYNCYKHIEQNDANNVPLLLRMADCLIHEQRFDEALPILFKAEYLDPSTGCPLRALAWCSLLTGRKEQAERYYLKILATTSTTAEDYLNAGHCAWLSGNITNAVNRYKVSIKKSQPSENVNDFFGDDTVFLYKSGLSENDLQIMIDCLRLYKLRK